MHQDDKPWITARIKSLISRRLHLFESRLPAWRSVRNQILRECTSAKREFYSNRVQRLKRENPRAWYKYIKLMTSNKPCELVINIPGGPENITDKEIADKINDGFLEIAEQIPSLSTSNLPASFPRREKCPFYVQPWDVYRELQKLQVGKSAGPDGISTRLIREYALELSTPICEIINASLEQGIVPQQWKESTIVPVPKSSPATIDKLRPIAITSHFAKLAEKFVCKWLLRDIEADKPGYTSTVVLTDFSKAFDLVDHNIAIRKIFLLELHLN
nr:uncharacterized protein LOC129270186 [Lytechinus pictus]